jgi:hypothetical protein
MEKQPNSVRLVPTTDVQGRISKWAGDYEFSLSAPILDFPMGSIVADEFRATAVRVLDHWIGVDNDNLTRLRSGRRQFTVPCAYRTNELISAAQESHSLSRVTNEHFEEAAAHAKEAIQWIGGQLLARGDVLGGVLATLLFHQCLPRRFAQTGRLFGSYLHCIWGGRDVGSDRVIRLMKLLVPRVRFWDCDAGWIHFTVTVGKETTEIRASHIYDPFPDMLSWLERIVAGKPRSSFFVDQEGIKTQFMAVQKDAGRLLIGVRDIGGNTEVRIRKLVDKRRFVAAFYGSFVRFARSKRYVEEQWAFVSLGDRVAAALPQANPEEMPTELATLDRDKLRKLFFHVAPSYEVAFEGEAAASEKIGRFVDLVLHPDSEEAKKGLVETPTEWEIPIEFDTWQITRRTEYLSELLREPANSWRGYKLDTLSSPIVERYLAMKDEGERDA